VRLRGVLVAAAGVSLMLLLAGFADAQCVMCKSVLMSSAEGRHLSQSLNYGIVLMLFAPYVIVTTFLAFYFRSRWQPALVRVVRRARGLS
jgi:hypothetical protein